MKASYPQPVVVEAPDGVLDPANAVSGATVRVTYAMLDTDIIGLAWDGHDDVAPQQNGNPGGTVDFIVPASAVNATIGRTIQVIYAVVRSGIAELSDILNLTVTAVEPEVKPIILNVTGASGDVENGGETPDDILTIEGSAGPGVTVEVFDYSFSVDTRVADPDGAWSLTLSGLTQGPHEITARTVGGVLVAEPWAFQVIGVTRGAENWETNTTRVFEWNQPVQCADGLIITRKSGWKGRPAPVIVDTASVLGHAVRIGWGIHLDLEFERPIRKIKFSYGEKPSGADIDVDFFGVDNNVIHSYRFKHVTSPVLADEIVLPCSCSWCRIEYASGAYNTRLGTIEWSS